MTRFPSLSRRALIELAGLLAILIVNAVYLNYAYLHEFDSNDYGGLIDCAWRILHGQKPYVDFMFNIQPVYIYVMALFSLIFGFGKTPILAHLLFMSSAFVIMTFGMFRGRIHSAAVLLLLTVLSMVACYWPYPFPIPIIDGYVFFTPAIWAMIAFLPFQNNKQAALCGFAAGACTVLSFMTKSNLGVALGGILFIVLMISPRRKAALAGFVTGAAILSAALFPLVHDLGKFWFHTTAYLGTQSSRWGRFLRPQNYLINFYWLPLVIVTLNVAGKIRKAPELFALFAGIGVAAVFIYQTSTLLGSYHITLFGIYLGIGWMLMEKLKPDADTEAGWKVPLRKISCVVLIITAVGQIAQTAHYSWRVTTPNHPVKVITGEVPIQSEPYRGWLAPAYETAAFDQIVGFVNENIGKNESLLVMTNMYLLYSITGRESYRGVPFQFAAQVAPAPGPQREMVRANILNNPPDWIVTHRIENPLVKINEILFYLDLEDYVLGHYQLAKSWGPYGILKKMR